MWGFLCFFCSSNLITDSLLLQIPTLRSLDALKGLGLVELLLDGNPFKDRLDPKVYVRYYHQHDSNNNGQRWTLGRRARKTFDHRLRVG